MGTVKVAQPYTLINELAGLVDEIKPDSIVSRTFYKGARMNAMIFGFDTGQELSEHTSSKTAILQILEGTATVTLGDDTHELHAGAWVQMQPHLKHSVFAKSKVLMLLSLIDTE